MKPLSRTALWNALALPLTALACPIAVAANYVVTNTMDSGPGSLRAVIASSNATPGVPDEIEFSPALDGQTILIGSELFVSDRLKITAPGPGRVTIRRDPAASAFRLFHVDDGMPSSQSPLDLTRLALENGLAADNDGGPWISTTARGGAILSIEPLTLVDCVVSGNAAVATSSSQDVYARGGAIFVIGGALSLVDSVVTENATSAEITGAGNASADGPIFVSNQSSAYSMVVGSVIAGNVTKASAPIGEARASGSSFVSRFSLDGSQVLGNMLDARGGSLALAAAAGLNVQASFNPYQTSLEDCLVSGNTATAIATRGNAQAVGGGVALAHLGGGSMYISRCSIIDNQLYAEATLELNGAGVSGVAVEATAFGGGVSIGGLLDPATAEVSGSTIAGNEVHAVALARHQESGLERNVSAEASAWTAGAALFAATAPELTFTLANSTISGNTLTSTSNSYAISDSEVFADAISNAQSGGSLHLLPFSALISNNTIVENEASVDGSATATTTNGGPQTETLNHVAEGAGVQALSNGVELVSNLVAQNSVSAPFGSAIHPDLSGTFINPRFNLVSDASGSNLINGVNGNIVTVVPQVAALTDNGGPTATHALLPGVIAIDSGGNPLGLEADQRGYISREVGGTADIGAYEFGAEPPFDLIFANGFD